MTTSEERREVAARLRATKAECEERGYPWMVEDLLQALGFETYEDGDDGIFDRLADLIDPTCDAEQGYDRDEPIQGRWWKCDVCGEHFIYERGFAPRFCPECGARVVNE